MSEGEPAVLRDAGAVPPPNAPATPRPELASPPRQATPRSATVYVVGFWKRALAAAIDLAVVVPTAIVVVLVVGKIAGLHLPAQKLHVLDLDLWLDLVIDVDPALVMAIVLSVAIGLAYLLVVHIVLGRTLGMRVLKMQVIDIYGDRPSPGRCVARCAGYLASVATLFLGFLWIGFDAEKRGLHDWIAGTYVVRA